MLAILIPEADFVLARVNVSIVVGLFMRSEAMARISVERTHALGIEAARVKAQQVVEKLAAQYGLQPTWSGDKVQLKRSGVDGLLEIGERTVKVDVKLGMLMSPMSGMIQSEIERSLDKALV
jgi:putative polyhydroxyalkanoate system protein